MITVKNVSKTFKVARRNAGFTQAVKALFHKKYEYVKALEDISFSIGDGEMVGYIGPNGAGKSSTIKILSGILTPDSGTCLIDGLVPWKDRVSHVSNIGVVFGQRSGLWWDVPVIDSFYLLKDIYRIPDKQYKDTLDELVTLLNLSTIVKTPTRQLSLGQRMRCEIAASLLHRPKILFLDEPTIGLDAVSKIAVRNFILDMNKRHKTTVILTTHDMQDIETLTRRIILIGKGKILMDGDLAAIKSQYMNESSLTIDYSGNELILPEGTSLKSHTVSRGENGMISDGHAVIELDTSMISVSEAIRMLTNQVNITDIKAKQMSIDEVVVNMYKDYSL